MGGDINYHIHLLTVPNRVMMKCVVIEIALGEASRLWIARGAAAAFPLEIEIYTVYPADCWEGKEPIGTCSEV